MTLPCEDCPTREPIERRLWGMESDIKDIRAALFGDGGSEPGLVRQVKDLAMIADLGRFGLKLALWTGAGVVAAATALTQLKAAIVSLWHP